ncbi:MAG: hypothetical protein AB1427_19150 [Thermodesulfobacteriota bacterium]
MKKIKDQLKTIAKSLTSLSRQVEKASKQVDKMSLSIKTTVKKKAPAKKRALKGAPVKRLAAKKSKAKSTVLDSVLSVIKRSRKGANTDTLRKKTGLGARQLSNALYKLSKRGVIVAKSRGLYTIK